MASAYLKSMRDRLVRFARGGILVDARHAERFKDWKIHGEASASSIVPRAIATAFDAVRLPLRDLQPLDAASQEILNRITPALRSVEATNDDGGANKVAIRDRFHVMWLVTFNNYGFEAARDWSKFAMSRTRGAQGASSTTTRSSSSAPQLKALRKRPTRVEFLETCVVESPGLALVKDRVRDNLRSAIGKESPERLAHLTTVFASFEKQRESLGIDNLITPWFFLADERGRVRLRLCGKLTPQDVEVVTEALRRLDAEEE